MRKQILLWILLLSAVASLAADGSATTDLRFDENGRFKVMQLTDLHFNGVDRWQSAHVPAMLVRLIEQEKPDLIVVTGDLIYRRPGAAMLYEICGVLASTKVPYAVALGNHDAEQGLDHAALYALIRTLPGCVNARYNAPDQRQGDFVIPVLAHDGRSQQARLYIMDSNDYNADDHSYKGFTPEQVAWYEAQRLTAERENKRKVDALLFCHIPLNEFAEAFVASPLAGVRLERECPGRDNAGMFDALVRGGDVIGVFAGHDHSNNYVARKADIALAYGQYSGGYAEYQELLSGARLILLKEGERGFTTWVRLANGREKWRIAFPQAD